MKLKVCSYYLKKEKLARLIKSQKLRGQKKTVPERLTLVIIKIKNISKCPVANLANKNKEYKQKKKYQQSKTKSRVNQKISAKCTYCGQDGPFANKCFKTRTRGYKGKPENSTGV